MKLGIIGLGKMGSNLALQAVEKGISVVGKARSPKPELSQKGVKVVSEFKDLADFLETPRVIFLFILTYLPLLFLLTLNYLDLLFSLITFLWNFKCLLTSLSSPLVL